MPRQSLIAIGALLGLLASGCPPLIGVSTIAATQPYYSAGDLRLAYNPRHAFVSLGCIEVAPSVRVHDRAIVLDWSMGNRCNEAVLINLAKLDVIATTETGASTRMKLFDPSDEIRELALPARRLVFEPIELTGDFTPIRICLDVEKIQGPVANPPGEICFVREGREWETERSGGS